ncbi:ribonuclease catalytic domain-containing protein [Thermodesulforhabdus norvegica]|uniref:Exoribonuclease-2 n=1 Tax=Thermodesulforhabdus norvegica TaxID=39841 RepID=A0A1I4U4Q6_9BACT|nr:ribonuclease catalytic domain-containing protein [Thermodesulforhabdus norvegica]SFM83811.1 exoribonuclease-2 [Thermodesulforhabdus norvegica]
MNRKEEILPGTVVEFFQDQEVYCAVVTGTKNQRLLVLSEANRELNISRSRILGVLGPRIDINKSRDEIIDALKRISSARSEKSKKLDIEELWALVEEEGESGFTIQELAGFMYEDPDPEQMAALQRALINDKLLFQYKAGIFYPRSRENVEQKKIQIEREEERKREVAEGAKWLKTLTKGHIKEQEPPCEIVNKIVERIKDFAIRSGDSPHFGFVKELFKEAELNVDPQVAFRILVKAGIWKEDENLLLYQFDIPRDFNRETLEFAEKIDESSHEDALDALRRDLTTEPTFSIDGPETRDIDDALSVSFLSEGIYLIGVHITDVSSYVQPDDPLDRSARSRMSTAYLPDERIPMLPIRLSEDLCSLVQGKKRRAISFLFRVDAEGNILSEEIIPSFVCVKKRLTYDEANRMIETDPELRVLHNVARRLQERRVEKGALIIHVPEVQALVDEDGTIHLKRYTQDEPSQILVSEWMIAANSLAARFFQEHSIPAIYRCQSEPREEEEIPGASDHPLFYMLHKRRLLARAEFSMTPERHCSLGLDCYVSITSPIRRYVDLVMQRQLRHYLLKGEPYYDQEKLDTIITEMNATLPKIAYVSRRWNRYWILKYLKQHAIKEVEALVLDQNERSFHLVLPEYMLETNVVKTGAEKIATGQVIRAEIEKVNPRDDTLKVRIL